MIQSAVKFCSVCGSRAAPRALYCVDCAYQPYCGVPPSHSYKTQGTIFGRMRESALCEVYKGIQDYLFEKLAGLIGLSNKQRRDVRANLIEAHDELKRIGFLSGYEVREDTVKPTINHTPSQNRHLVRKIVKSRRPKGTV